jgi:hypothetical protein
MEFPRFECPRDWRVLFVAAPGMLAKQRGQGKPGNLLLAMRRHGSRRLANFTLQNSVVAFLALSGGMADKW